MTRTEYLFGCSCDEFPEQEAFARKRIAKAKELKAELVALDLRGMTSEMVDAIHYRYQEVDTAEAWSVRLLSEALGAEND